jgi:hypothetical protein
MSLRRVGGAGDAGIDLRGSWYIPHDAMPASRRRAQRIRSDDNAIDKTPRAVIDKWRRLQIVGQCKAEKKPLGPRAVRELEGVVAHLEGESRGLG